METDLGVPFFLWIFLLVLAPGAALADAANLDNLKRCFKPYDAKIATDASICEVEGLPGSPHLLYPDPVQKGPGAPSGTAVVINGCYDTHFRRVRDVPGGDPSKGTCEESDAPIRVYLRYRTTCSRPDANNKCTYGAQILVIPEVHVDGPTPFGAGFNPMLSLGVPIKIGRGVAAYTAKEGCEVLAKSDTGYDQFGAKEILSCTKTPKDMCKEIGFHWSELDEKCITAHVDTKFVEALQLPELPYSDKCNDKTCENDFSPDFKHCSGEAYVPTGFNCFCAGTASEYLDSDQQLDRSIASSTFDKKGACRWLHYEVKMNPVCEPWNDPPDKKIKYVADPGNPMKDRCCHEGRCPGYDVRAYSNIDTDPLRRLSTTYKEASGNSGIAPRNFYQIGPVDNYPSPLTPGFQPPVNGRMKCEFPDSC